MKKLICFISLIVLSMLAACITKNTEYIGFKDLGIDASKGRITDYIDTHGSLGDGCTYITIEFYGDHADAIDNELQDNEKWRSMPLSNNLQTVIYGDEERKPLEQSFDKEIPAIPKITNGYYYFNDRHSESTDSTDDTYLYSRSSYNFDIMIYDMDLNKLYIFQLDT